MTQPIYRIHIVIYVLAFLAMLFFTRTPVVFGAEFRIVAPENAPQDGMVHVEVTARTDQDQPFNAAEGTLTFPSELFSVANISTDDSIFNLWTVEPTVSGNGTISFAGGTPALGGFIFTGILFDVALVPLGNGSGTVTITDGAILAHDGVGTDILTDTIGKDYRIEDAVPATYDTNSDGTVSIEELSIGMTIS